MKFRVTAFFQKDYARLPKNIQKKVDKQLIYLSENPQHPSLRLKKLVGTELFEIRVDLKYRLTLRVMGDIAELRRVGPHDILQNEGKTPRLK